MDVEDWQHLEYFAGMRPPEPRTSMLDGLDRFRELLAAEAVPATFFTLGEVGIPRAPLLRELAAEGHEVASHGPDHRLLKQLSTAEFVAQMRTHKDELEQALGMPVAGYRAPCFSMDREKLERLPELGFAYDSSWIRFGAHPLYGHMELDDWREVVPGVRRAPGADFMEFEIPTLATRRGRVPVGGGAYFRIFPWLLTRRLVGRFLDGAEVYIFYIHPFEMSAVRGVELPAGVGMGTKLRFQTGRARTAGRFPRLVRLLRERGFSFSTFEAFRESLAS
jgi:polysaccharide deacetylase family protein (PEP-CTERM system associated)